MKKTPNDADAALIQEILTASIGAMGRGGLTWLADKLGITVSALRKRLHSKTGAFDAVTLRAVLLVLASKAEKFNSAPIRSEQNGKFVVEVRTDETGAEIPTWRPKK